MALGTGGPNIFGQRGVLRTDREIDALVKGAIDQGINLFDTAPGYGGGRSEELLCHCLQGIPRDKYVLSTKTAVVTKERDGILSPAEFRESVENSLRRLGTDHLDVLLLAGVLDGGWYNRVTEDLVPEAQRLKAEGKIRFLGASESSSSDGEHLWLSQLLTDDLVDVVMVAYGLLNHSAEGDVFTRCQKRNVGAMVIYAVRRAFSQPARLVEIIRDLKQRGLVAPEVSESNPLGWLLENDEDCLSRVAYWFSASHPAVSTVLTGTTNPRHLRANIAALQSSPIPMDKLERLRELFGHLCEPIGN